jgi:RNA polymerase sigma-70 factor (ECF subfamily)
MRDDQRPATAGASRRGLDEDQVRGVYRYIYGQVGNREEAEELTERAFARAMRAASQAAPGVNTRQAMEALLLQTAHSVIAEQIRQPRRLSAPVPEGQAGGDTIAAGPAAATDRVVHRDDEPAERVRRILAQLPPRDRDLLTWRFLRQASLAETADALHVTVAEALRLQWSALNNAARIAAGETAIPADPRAGG